MTDSQRAKNCAKCRLRRSNERWLNQIFDYTNCPFVCVQNKLYDRLRLRKRGNLWN